MEYHAFERIAAEEFAAVPAHFKRRLDNVALLLEDEPSEAVRLEEGLGPDETLLGRYHGIPASERGDFYSGVLPDTITLYRLPLLEEAAFLGEEGRADSEADAVRLAIRETLWHELGHYFGMDEAAVHAREEAGTNRYAQGTEGSGPAAARGSMLEPVPTRMAKAPAIASGSILVLLGISGFVSNPLIGAHATFAADLGENILHLLLGALLLWIAFRVTMAAQLWLQILGTVLFLLGLIGLVAVPASGGTLLGIAYTNAATNWLHLVGGAIMFLAGLYSGENGAART